MNDSLKQIIKDFELLKIKEEKNNKVRNKIINGYIIILEFLIKYYNNNDKLCLRINRSKNYFSILIKSRFINSIRKTIEKVLKIIEEEINNE